jgi:predicted hydrocarbon binding protein
MLTKVTSALGRLARRGLARTALAATSLATGHGFWVEAVLGRNQLAMHLCKKGVLSIGGVSEQLYGEGFVRAFHAVLREHVGGDEQRLEALLRELGEKGARWEVEEAIHHGVWVPWFLKGYAGKPEMLGRVRRSRLLGPLLEEALAIVFRMIMTEGGWGEVLSVEIASEPMVVRVRNAPETRGGESNQRAAASAAPKGCYLLAGIYRAYFATIFGKECDVREATCASRGAEACTFEMSFAVLPSEKKNGSRPRRLPVVAGA